MKLIILAAGQGSRLRPLTNEKPKCLVELKNKSLIEWQISVAKKVGIKDIIVLRGYKKEKLDYLEKQGIILVDNLEYDTTNMVETLFKAEEYFTEEVIISYGDIVYEEVVLENLIKSKKDISVVIDHGWEKYWRLRNDDIYSDAESLVLDNDGCIKNIGKKVDKIDLIQGQYIGLTKFNGYGIEKLKQLYTKEKEAFNKGKNYICTFRNLKQIYMTDVLQKLIDEQLKVYEVPINRGWVEIDNVKDLEIAEKLMNCKDNKIQIK